MAITISIVINNYNYARYLKAAIDSALRQTKPALEVIVVDDGSTDESRTVLASYGVKIRAILQDNGGQRSAYNRGFLEAGGDLIMFLDSDDILEPNAVEEITRHWRPGASKLHFPMKVITTSEARKDVAIVPLEDLPDGDVLPAMLKDGYYTSSPGSGNIYSREFLRQVLPMVTRSKICADTVTVHLAPFFGEVIAIKEVLACYRIHGGNQYSGSLNGKALRQSIQNDVDRISIIEEEARRRGIAFDARRLDHELHHLKLRLSSLRLDAANHPFKQDNRLRLAWRGVRAAQRLATIPTKRKLLFVIWFGLAAIAPRSLVGGLVNVGCSPASRSDFLRRLLRPGRPSASKVKLQLHGDAEA